MQENEWRNWAEQENRSLKGAIRSVGRRRSSSGGGLLGASAGLGVVAVLLGIVFVVALPIIYPSFLIGRIVADAIHPLPGILIGLTVFVAALALLYFSRVARAIYSFPFALIAQLGIFVWIGSASDFVWASGAAILIGLLLYRMAFATVRFRGEESGSPLPAWIVSAALAVASLIPNFFALTVMPDTISGSTSAALPSPAPTPVQASEPPLASELGQAHLPPETYAPNDLVPYDYSYAPRAEEDAASPSTSPQ